MALRKKKPPTSLTTEIGRPGLTNIGGSLLPWSSFIDDREFVPELTWPNSIPTYARMQSDAQIKGLLMATTLPIRRYRWEILENEAKPEVIDHVAESYNLPVQGADPKPTRRRKRFNHDRHLAHALRAIASGHMHFERVYEYRDPRDGGDGLLHLKKLGTRPPRTIARILPEDNGELAGIEQSINTIGIANLGSALVPPILDASRLLTFLWDSEDDGDLIGRSILRACYRDWIIKDRLIRVDATKHERNGMGIPWFEVDPNASDAQIKALAAIAEEIRAGERGGGAGPGRLRIAGTEGTLPDTIGSIRYCDQQMSRAFLLLFFDLGTTETGSRSLGGSFIEWYVEAQAGIADWYAGIMQEQIEDEVALNWGEDEQPPAIGYTRLEDTELSIGDLATAVKEGLIEVDDELRAYIVSRWKLPKQPLPSEAPPPPPPPPTIVMPPGGPPAPADEETEGDMEPPAPASPAESPASSPAA